MTKRSNKLRYILVFMGTLLFASVVHWGWHLFGEGGRSGMLSTGEPVVSICEPPFCDKTLQDELIDSEKSRGKTSQFSQDAADPLIDFPRADFQGYTVETLYPEIDSEKLARMGTLTPDRVICVVDMVGEAGFQFALMQGWQLASMAHGMRPQLKVYTDARIALEDLKAGACQAAWLPGDVLDNARDDDVPVLNSLQAFGAITTREQVGILASVLSQPYEKTKSFEGESDYAMMGLTFSGPAYFMFNKDFDAGSLGVMLTGRRVASITRDQKRFLGYVGATAVEGDISKMAVQFNNGSVDGVLATLAMISPLDLDKGLNPSGMMLDVPMYESTWQLIAHKKAFTVEENNWSREYFYQQAQPLVEKNIALQRESVGAFQRSHFSAVENTRAESLLRTYRVAALADGVYDAPLLTLMRKVRCKLDSSREECVSPTE